MYPGRFITMEGTEGCGKTTQCLLLAQYLIERNQPVLYTREPGGTATSDQIRKVLLAPENRLISKEAELLLYLADRAQHVSELIVPGLKEGRFIVCDRFADATVAYQGFGRGLDLDLIHNLNRFVTGGLKPDLTFILDADVEEGLRRAIDVKGANKGGDRLEREDLGFHHRVREGYLKLAAQEPDRIKVVNSGMSVDDTFEEIRQHVDELLRKQHGL